MILLYANVGICQEIDFNVKIYTVREDVDLPPNYNPNGGFGESLDRTVQYFNFDSNGNLKEYQNNEIWSSQTSYLIEKNRYDKNGDLSYSENYFSSTEGNQGTKEIINYSYNEDRTQLTELKSFGKNSVSNVKTSYFKNGKIATTIELRPKYDYVNGEASFSRFDTIVDSYSWKNNIVTEITKCCPIDWQMKKEIVGDSMIVEYFLKNVLLERYTEIYDENGRAKKIVVEEFSKEGAFPLTFNNKIVYGANGQISKIINLMKEAPKKLFRLDEFNVRELEYSFDVSKMSQKEITKINDVLLKKVVFWKHRCSHPWF